jgi:hypothetical protein
MGANPLAPGPLRAASNRTMPLLSSSEGEVDAMPEVRMACPVHGRIKGEPIHDLHKASCKISATGKCAFLSV